MKNCWDVLGIEPATDKKTIKRAYAAKTREIHPEEKPEEFKQLYEAYQAALGYADYILKSERIEAETGRPYKSSPELADEVLDEKRTETETSEESEAEKEELLSYFEEKQERQKPRVDAFLQYWNEIQSPRDNPKMLDWWKEYLASEEFQDIRYQPQVLYVLARELDKKFFYRLNDLKILFWDAYEFQEGQESTYQGDMRRIWKSLYPAYQKQRRTIQKEQKLLSYFEEKQERHEQRIDAFLQYWDEMQSPFCDPKALNRWKTYLSSEEFQEIRLHTEVLSLLADGTDDKRFYGVIEVEALLWDAYGFQEGEGAVYQGDTQRLYRNLYPAFLYRKQEIAKKENRRKINKRILLCLGIAAAVALAGCVVDFIRDARQMENERLFLADYMAKQYPMAAFSEPERLGEEEDGDIVYTMNPLAHPELSVTAVVKRDEEREKNRRVTEDYSQVLFRFYAAQYGLEAGLAPYTADTNALFYSDIEEVDAFCEQAEKMFREQEELQVIPEVAFLPQNVLFSLVMFDGGSVEYSFADKQVYDPKTLKAEELSASLREAYMLYMFRYESWNITKEQYREWGAAYETMCKEWENDDGEWLDVHDPNTGETLCRLFVSTYERPDTYSYRDGKVVPIYTRVMTLGNAYHFLRDRDADIIVDENGRGFHVKFYGTNTWFGYESEVEFDDLRDCY